MEQTLTVEGMSCDGCESAVVKAVSDVSGVTDVSADHEQNSVTVEGDANTDEIVAAIETAGYQPQ